MLDKNYWESRYEDGKTGWDLNSTSKPINHILESIENKKSIILFPGAGVSHDPMNAILKGFPNVYVNEWSEEAMNIFFERFPEFPREQFLLGNFFKLNQKFDIIIEQTFFCAIDPKLREDYVQQVFQLLSENGILTGVLFDMPLRLDEGPPFGGNPSSYEELFSPYFIIEKLEKSDKSISPRMGRELFFKFKKRKI